MKKMSLILLLLSVTVLIKAENPRIPLPPKTDYTPLPSGIAFLSITNNNSQAMAVSEQRKETTICPPPVILTSSPSHQGPNNHESSKFNGYKDYGFQLFEQLKKTPLSITSLSCALGVGALTYAILYARLVYLSKKVTLNQGWGSFQAHIKPYTLSQLPTNALAEKLIEEIKKKYTPLNPNNLMAALLSFNHDVEEELEQLTSFINFYSTLMALKLSYLLPDHRKTLELAQEKTQRLHLYKEAILSWTNENSVRLIYNVEVPRSKLSMLYNDEIMYDAVIKFDE